MKNVLLPLIVMNLFGCSEAFPDSRLVISNDQIWSLSETNLTLEKVSARFQSLSDASSILAIDARDAGAQSGIGVAIVRQGSPSILLLDGTTGRPSKTLLGENPAFDFLGRKVGFFKINPRRAEDAFYIADLNGGSEREILSGGFFEVFPAVYSGKYFYVFRSGAKRTVRIDAETGVVDEPEFLNQRVVVAAWNNSERLLVEERVTKKTMVITGAGANVAYVENEQPFVGLEFSRDGQSVYVTLARSEGIREIFDLATYNLKTGQIKIVKRDFTVSRGQMSRAH